MRRFTLLAAVAALGLGACADAAAGGAEGSWVLQSGTNVNGEIPIVDGHPITLQLQGGRIHGNSACNIYMGEYQIGASGRFRIVDGLAVTERACLDAVAMESERLYLEALGGVDRITQQGDRLTLSGGGHTLVFVADDDTAPPSGRSDAPDQAVSSGWFPPEANGRWLLDRGVLDEEEIPIVETHPVTLEVSDETFGGTICNSYGHALPLPEDGSFPDIAQTLMLCLDDRVMKSEEMYLEALGRFGSAAVIEGRLVVTGQGVELVYRRER